MRQVRSDFIKFVPFSLFLLIPGGELFLPAWVLIFPNSIPSQFIGEDERIKKFAQLRERQEDAAEKLQYILTNYIARLLQHKELSDTDREVITRLRQMLKQGDFEPQDLLEYRGAFTRFGKFRMFRTKTLMHMAHFMGISPVTGLNTINNILRLFKTQIPVDGPYIHVLTKMIVARELNMYFNRLRNEDQWLDMEDIDNYPESQLTKICFQRGINITQSRPEQLRDLKLWLEISNKRNVPHSLLMYIVLHDFNQVNKSEKVRDAASILKESEEKSQLESVRAFEKAFGLTKLEQIIADTKMKRNVSRLRSARALEKDRILV